MVRQDVEGTLKAIVVPIHYMVHDPTDLRRPIDVNATVLDTGGSQYFLWSSIRGRYGHETEESGFEDAFAMVMEILHRRLTGDVLVH